jgi:hypothetical protein
MRLQLRIPVCHSNILPIMMLPELGLKVGKENKRMTKGGEVASDPTTLRFGDSSQ